MDRQTDEATTRGALSSTVNLKMKGHISNFDFNLQLICVNKTYSFFSRNLELKCQIFSLNVVHVFNLKCIEFIELNSSAKQIECNRPNSKVTRAYQVGSKIWHK